MNTLPPLQLVDDCFFIDNTFLERLTTCPRSLEYSELLRRIGSAAKPSLTFGSALHLALEQRYRRCGNRKPDLLEESEICLALSDFYRIPENMPPEDDWRNLNWAIEVFKQYNNHYATEPFDLLVNDKGEILTELPFVLELHKHGDIRILFSGRIDLPVLWDKQTFVIDHKTTSVLGDNFFKDHRVSPQLFGYCLAFEQITKRKVNGFCVNAIRSRPAPAKPVGGFDRWWSEGFGRHKEYIFPHQIEEWRHNTIALIEEFFWHYERAFMPQKKKWCVGKYGECQYYGVCDLPPDQRPVLLSSNLFTDNTWTPLHEPSQALQ